MKKIKKRIKKFIEDFRLKRAKKFVNKPGSIGITVIKTTSPGDVVWHKLPPKK